jgi:hypothetical protein
MTPGKRKAMQSSSQDDDAGERKPAPAAEAQRPGLAAPAAHGDIALRHPQQMALQVDERQRHQRDRDHDHGHELIRGLYQNIRQLE